MCLPVAWLLTTLVIPGISRMATRHTSSPIAHATRTCARIFIAVQSITCNVSLSPVNNIFLMSGDNP